MTTPDILSAKGNPLQGAFPARPRSFAAEKNHNQGEHSMPTITTKDGTQIYYKDWGTGQPMVFSHGWPLTADAWDAQMFFFGQHGYRVIAHRPSCGGVLFTRPRASASPH